MQSVKRLRLYFRCAAVMLTVFSMTVLVMPLSNMLDGEKQRIMLLLVGGIFWFSFFTGYLFLFLAKGINRKWEKNMDNSGKKKKHIKMNLYSFDMPTAIADTCFLTGWIVLLLLKFTRQTTGYVVYIDLFIILMSFHVHLLFSGSLYKRVIDSSKKDFQKKERRKL